jgi:hypothetical protein
MKIETHYRIISYVFQCVTDHRYSHCKQICWGNLQNKNNKLIIVLLCKEELSSTVLYLKHTFGKLFTISINFLKSEMEDVVYAAQTQVKKT